MAVLAAVTLDDLRAIAEKRVKPAAWTGTIWIPLALSLGTLLLINGGILSKGRIVIATVAAAAPGVVIVAAITLLVVLAGRGVRWSIPALIVAAAIDLAVWGITFVYLEPPRPIVWLTRMVPPAPREVEASYAAATDDGPIRSNIVALKGYRLTTGYVGLYPASRHEYFSDEGLRLSGTRWRFDPEGTRSAVHGTVDRVRVIDRDERPAPGSARMAVDRPGRLVAHVDAPGPGILAFTERFHSGWSATADGRPLRTVRVAGDFLGCELQPGVHRVTLRFMPRSFVQGASVSAVGVILLVAVLVAGWRRDQIASRSRTPSR
jgi:hypothetical protein